MWFKRKMIAEINAYLQQHYIGEAPLARASKAQLSAPGYFGKTEDDTVILGKLAAPTTPAPKEHMPLPKAPTAPAPKEHMPLPKAPIAPAPKGRMPLQEASTRASIFDTVTLPDLNDRIKQLDESFQQALLRLIDERGMKDSDCYKRAGVDRKLFSKIRSNPDYRPSKPTAVAFAIALRLSLDETADFLRKAGYALSRSSKFDVIVEYFIVNKRYDLHQLNVALYEFDQPLINA